MTPVASSDALQRLKSRRRPAEQPLSGALGITTATKKIVAVGKGITCIDGVGGASECKVSSRPRSRHLFSVWAGVLPPLTRRPPAAATQALYLSNNRLASLDGIQQFTNLRACSLSDNQLASFEALLPLARAAPSLEAAAFEGNPLCELPNYRLHVVHIMPSSLHTLDGRPVGPEERPAAGGVCAVEAALLAAAVANACLVHQLGRGVQLLRLHEELRRAVGCASRHNQNDAARICRMLAAWRCEAALGGGERAAIEQAIVREARRRHARLGPAAAVAGSKGWQQAYAQVLVGQLEAATALLELLAPGAGGVPAAAGSASPAKAMPLAATPAKGSRRGAIESLKEALLELAALRPTPDAEARAAECGERAAEARAGLLRSAPPGDDEEAENDAEWTISATPAPASPPAPPAGEPPRDEAAAEQARAVAELQAAADELAARLQGCEQRAAAAEASLRLHRQESAAQQQAVAALTAWLQEANAARAAAEAERAQLAAGAEAEAAALRMHLSEMVEVAEGAQAEGAAAVEAARQQAAGLARRLEALHAERLRREADAAAALPEAAEELRRERARADAAAARAAQLEATAAEGERRERMRLAAERVHEQSQAHNALRLWREAAEAESRLRGAALLAAQRRSQRVAAAGLGAWRLAARRSRSVAEMRRRQEAAAAQRAWRCWRAHARSERLLGALGDAAATAAALTLLRRALTAWRRHAEARRQVELPDGCALMQLAAAQRLRSALGTAFSAWRACAEAEALPRQAGELLAAVHLQSRLRRQALAGWRVAAARLWEERLDHQRGTAAREMLLVAKAFADWQRHHRRQVRLAAGAAAVAALCKRMALCRAVAALQHWRQLSLDQRRARSARQACAALSEWRQQAGLARGARAAAPLALAAWRRVVAHKHRRTALVALGAWRRSAQLLRAETLASEVGRLQDEARRASSAFELASIELAAAQQQIALLRAENAGLEGAEAALQARVADLADELASSNALGSELHRGLEAAHRALDAAAVATAAALGAADSQLAAERAARQRAQHACDLAVQERAEAVLAAEASEARASTARDAAQAAAAACAARAEGAEAEGARAAAAERRALERAEGAAAAGERLVEQCNELQQACLQLERARSILADRLSEAGERGEQAGAAAGRLERENAALRQQLAALERERLEVAEERGAAQGDARAALRQSRRLAALVEEHRQALLAGPC
jgi:hypothetical protein